MAHENRTITSSFIARRYLKEIGSNRDWKVAEFRDRVSVELRAQVTLSQAKRAKMKAIALIDGNIKDQYKIMWDYCNEIDRTNPGSTVCMKFIDNEIPNEPQRFQRIYICFASCKLGFRAGCRKIVGVDGCWLKGPMYGTQLLSAVGMDGNNNIFPVAYAIVEKESKDTWVWFLNHLAADLNIHETGWNFMSDKQKGLIEAFNEVFPHVNHRFCVRHLHNNFKRAGFGGITLKKALWAAAKATTRSKFNNCMEDILKLDPDAATWLNDKDPSEWSMSHFSSDAKCDTLLNNMCEVFNSMILDARDKPIVTLLEKLRYLLMARMLANREKAEKWNLGNVCPKIKDMLHKNQIAAAEYIPRKSNYWSYEILGATVTDNWAVDLQNKSCSCRKWSLTGVPCKHAIAAIWAKKDNILDYVHDCYKVEIYRRIYENSILPMNGPQLWPKSSKVPPLPPKIVRNSKRGRMQKLRRKEQDEVGASRTKMKRKQKSLDCSICHKPGHNKRTCKYNIVQEETTSSVRPKLHVTLEEDMMKRDMEKWNRSKWDSCAGILLLLLGLSNSIEEAEIGAIVAEIELEKATTKAAKKAPAKEILLCLNSY
uniref:SWIM-type domain-containing protein n=1 Tax=Nicotiana tabacum TaxID=4097 RepID=A0A1S3XKY6_TOBAC|nr:PREDICTED: uncharacterized protein LOC107766336 [Nicotiana tabacum]